MSPKDKSCKSWKKEIMGRITTPLLKLPITKIVIKVNKNDIDLRNCEKEMNSSPR
jgi:hypothetical protein